LVIFWQGFCLKSAMDIFPWYLQVLLGLNFLVSAAFGAIGVVVAFWFVKLLQAAVRALDRWQPSKSPQSNGKPNSSQVASPDDSKYRPKVGGKPDGGL
jgi:hypothetical protein